MPDVESPEVCERVGEPSPDIAGIGILVGFTGQAFLSLALAGWVFLLSRHGRLDVQHEEGSDEHKIEKKRLEMVQEILMVGNDLQMLTGTALMITAFCYVRIIDLYHLHLLYDTVSFVGVSNAAAVVCYTFCETKAAQRENKKLEQQHKGHLSQDNSLRRFILVSPRYRATYLFATLFLALTILLSVRLNDWSMDPSAPMGSCYRTVGTSKPTAGHPGSDKTYVAITATWLLLVMMASLFGSARHRRFILAGSFLQFPVHLYMMLALRRANVGALEGDGEDENDWDFGQTAATLLLGVAVSEFIAKGREFYRFEKEVRRRRKEHNAARDSRREAREGVQLLQPQPLPQPLPQPQPLPLPQQQQQQQYYNGPANEAKAGPPGEEVELGTNRRERDIENGR